jgi:hypothetical protein
MHGEHHNSALGRRGESALEEEARQVLTAALQEGPKRSSNLAESIRRRIEPLGGVESDIPEREPVSPSPTFE